MVAGVDDLEEEAFLNQPPKVHHLSLNTVVLYGMDEEDCKEKFNYPVPWHSY